jgi:adenylosuccinate lyase
MRTWQDGVPFRRTLQEAAAEAGQRLDESRLDDAFRPERYVSRLGPVFDRLAELS